MVSLLLCIHNVLTEASVSKIFGEMISKLPCPRGGPPPGNSHPARPVVEPYVIGTSMHLELPTSMGFLRAWPALTIFRQQIKTFVYRASDHRVDLALLFVIMISTFLTCLSFWLWDEQSNACVAYCVPNIEEIRQSVVETIQQNERGEVFWTAVCGLISCLQCFKQTKIQEN